MLVEEDNDPLLGLEVGGCEDGEVGFGFCGSEREADLLKTKFDEPVGDDIANCFYMKVSLVLGWSQLVSPFMASRWRLL